MSFSREVKDFLGGFQAGWKMMDDSEYNAARSEYYRRAGTNKGKGSDNMFGYAPDDEEKPKNIFQRMFASTDTPEGGAGDVWEKGSRRFLLAEERAAAAGDADSLEKIQKMRLKYGNMIPQQKYAEGGPVEAIPTEPVAAPTEDTDGDGDFDIVDRMATAAQPGIDLALKNLEQKVSSAGGAVGDPNAGAELLARSEGAASQEEVDAIDQMIDPEGKLPPEARSAARIAAVTEFYLKQDQPEKAAELANKLLMYNKQNAETRGALAVRALQGGDIKSAAKLVRDMYNQDMPTGDLIQPAVATDGDIMVNEDGTVPVKIVRGGVTQEEVDATPEMIQQVASTAGQSWTQRLLQANAELRKRQAAAAAKKAGTSGGRGNIEGNTELIDAEIGRVMGIPVAPQSGAAQPAGPTAANVPMPPERPEEFQSPERRMSNALGIPDYPSEAPAQLRAPTKLPPVPDDTAPRTRTPFEVIERPVNDEFVEREPEAPTKPDYQPLPKFRADLLSPEGLARFEKMNSTQRSNFIRDWNARAAASAEKKKGLDAQYREELKAYKERVREVEKGNAPRVFDPGKADEFASSVDTSFKDTLTEEKFKQIPAGQRGVMRDLAVDIGARNRNITSGGAADAVLSLTAINEKNPDEAGFRVVRDPRTKLIYAQFPDGRTVRMSPETLTRLAALRTERRQQFEELRKKADEEGKKPGKVDRVISTGKGAIDEISGAVTGALNAPARPQDAEMAAIRNWYNAAGPRNEAINDLKSRPEVREAMEAMERARMRNDRKAYQAAAQRLRSLTNERYDSAIPTSGF